MGFCPQLGGVGPCPARCIWQGSGFAADQTNAMLATSNGGDKSSRNRESLRLLGITEEFSICGREIKCFFCWLLRNFSPFTQRFFGVPVWGWYHYPRRALHAVETLDARGSRRRIRRFYAAAVFALCGLTIPSACTPPPRPQTVHTAAHRGKHGAFSLPETSTGSIGSTVRASCVSSLSARRSSMSRFPLLRRTTAEMPILLSAATLCRIRRDTLKCTPSQGHFNSEG